ncbi:MAG TPA: Uma2 family endonuclease [Saprospiraceae bacterium]|nr:Uma2 family endonuclease [Saprospiraceae bacterium]
MVATALSAKPVVPTVNPAPRQPKPISWEAFQRRYLSREDGYTYEWTNGKIEKTPGTMDISQLYIWLNINRFFLHFLQKHPVQGSLMMEADIFLAEEIHRRPDICFLTDAQVFAGKKEKIQIPGFVIEIISPNDKANKVQRKVQDYFQAGVRVVWNVYPLLGEVHVFENAGAALIRRGDELCSAEAVIPGFAIPVSEIFKEG